MRTAILVLALLSVAIVSPAKDRQWKATVLDARTDVANGGRAYVPVAGALYSVPISRAFTWYYLETDDTIYTVGPLKGNKRLNVTLHGHVKVAVDGTNLHVLDDGGRDVKLAVTAKVAR